MNKKPGQLLEGTVHLQTTSIKDWMNHSKQLMEILSPNEKRRLDRLKFQDKKEEYLCSRGILRLILSLYLDQDPRSVHIETSANGKPFLVNEELQFNISHSAGNLICGYSLQNRIGVDLQEMYEISSIKRIIQHFFSSDELNFLRSLPDSKVYQEQFFSIWTAKEAYLKAVGDGIQADINQLSILPIPTKESSFSLKFLDSTSEIGQWTIKSLDIYPGYKAALAIEGEVLDITEQKIDPEIFFNSGSIR